GLTPGEDRDPWVREQRVVGKPASARLCVDSGEALRVLELRGLAVQAPNVREEPLLRRVPADGFVHVRDEEVVRCQGLERSGIERDLAAAETHHPKPRQLVIAGADCGA